MSTTKVEKKSKLFFTISATLPIFLSFPSLLTLLKAGQSTTLQGIMVSYFV